MVRTRFRDCQAAGGIESLEVYGLARAGNVRRDFQAR
jgi:hypothetical protein